MDRDTFISELRGFLAELNPADAEQAAALGPTDNLFDKGLVSSFTMVRLIVFVQQLTGVPVEVQGRPLEDFYTLDGLYRLVFEPEPVGGAAD
jgi:acyl carrier protein